MKQPKRIHLLGNAHIDPVWLWKRAEGYAEIKATFQSALDRMEESDHYIFTSACAAYYEWVEKNEPALFEKIRARVKEGRWAIAGGMWVQPDCNMPSGEAFARHLLYSQRYFLEKFGIIAQVGYNVDSFGHNGMLPQLFSRAGIKGYIFQRPSPQENPKLPPLFVWEAPDGSKIPTLRLMFSYGNYDFRPEEYPEYAGMGYQKAKVLEIRKRLEELDAPFMSFYGVGNHGGGPSRDCVLELERLCAEDPNVVFSSPDRYFEELREKEGKLQTVTGDLQRHAIGCYSAHSGVKRLNRMTENRLISAEKYDVLSSVLTGAPSQDEALRRGWKRLLFNQFHDVLAGCCIRESMDEACRYFNAAWTEGDEAAGFALQKLAWNVNTAQGVRDRPTGKEDWMLWESEAEGAPVVVFNPHSFPVQAPVQVNHSGIARVRDDRGTELPLQHVRGPQSNGDDNDNTLFLAELPPLGWRTYYLYRRAGEKAVAGPLLSVQAGERYILENQFLRVEFDPIAGEIARLTDKRTGKEVLKGGARALVMDDEDTDTWAHNRDFLGKEGEAFGEPTLEITEQGPVAATLRMTTRHGGSVLIQDFTLYAEKALLFVSVKLDCREDHKVIKLAFPVNGDCGEASYEMPFGHIDKPNTGEENVGQRYLSMGKGDAHLALLNDGKYSFSAPGSELRMVIARTCGYADHYSTRKKPIELMDQGEQAFTYALMPHGGDLAAVAREAMLLNQPPELILDTNHQGALDTSFSGLELSSSQVVCESVKYPHTGERDALILRLYETAGQPAETELSVSIGSFSGKASLTFGPSEVKTLRLEKNGSFRAADLLERGEQNG